VSLPAPRGTPRYARLLGAPARADVGTGDINPMEKLWLALVLALQPVHACARVRTRAQRSGEPV